MHFKSINTLFQNYYNQRDDVVVPSPIRADIELDGQQSNNAPGSTRCLLKCFIVLPALCRTLILGKCFTGW